MDTRIWISSEPFNISQEYKLLSSNNSDGAVVTFIGKVRSYNLGSSVFTLTLEHYASMAEKELESIVANARKRWTLKKVTVIHRIGKFIPGDDILFVGLSSAHRSSAFIAIQFIVDYLKMYAPFWKYETTVDGGRWLDVNHSDQQSLERWQQ
ncbi:molybdopterin synthase catalytic subunit MoaE [Candidatus Pantoea carbekii]|uniref:Molybdopterin synthase catalytic subunit n=1 Tax=Candidatus Pantoea carbekii TaxID=1235990 RepID=U3U9T1_9GAMM|nr:molybdopterin synthase catalytic subunit MoaE [Candidatus Pantoea carbekii]AKC32181.1 molybdopterin-converting factor subunit 2 MoaE [Candidatus Pantoea carbekii]BAO00708.1 hypothetical protein HHS_07380 [Candidatus Pantoea carbekii]